MSGGRVRTRGQAVKRPRRGRAVVPVTVDLPAEDARVLRQAAKGLGMQPGDFCRKVLSNKCKVLLSSGTFGYCAE